MRPLLCNRAIYASTTVRNGACVNHRRDDVGQVEESFRVGKASEVPLPCEIEWAAVAITAGRAVLDPQSPSHVYPQMINAHDKV